MNFSQDLGINLGWRSDLWYARHVTLTQSLGWLGPVAPVPPFTSLTHFLLKLLKHEYIIMFALHAEKLSSHTISTVVATPCPDPYLCLSFQSSLIVSSWRTTVNPLLEKVLLIRVVFFIRAFSCNLWQPEEIKEDWRFAATSLR